MKRTVMVLTLAALLLTGTALGAGIGLYLGLTSPGNRPTRVAAAADKPAPGAPQTTAAADKPAPATPQTTAVTNKPAPAAVQTTAVTNEPAPAAVQTTAVTNEPAAAPQIAATPGWPRAPDLEQAVIRAMQDFSGRYSVAVHDLTSGSLWTLGAHEQYHPASTIKLPVTLYALEQYRTGNLRWSDGIVYTQADFESPGGGAFETSPFGGVYPVENLVNRALTYSNNVAVNMLGRRLGWENIRTWTRSIGAELHRLPDASPMVTLLSELGWWLHLERLSHEEPAVAELLLKPLRAVAYQGRITAGLPEGVRHLHKFGSYNGHYHDGGVIYGDSPYILIIMTHGATADEADAAIARVSGAVWQVMCTH